MPPEVLEAALEAAFTACQQQHASLADARISGEARRAASLAHLARECLLDTALPDYGGPSWNPRHE